jgi:transcription elongation factor Elf1
LGRRKKRKKVVPKVVKRLPKIFLCPNCGRQSLSIAMTPIEGSDYSEAVARCGECGLCIKVIVPKLYQPVDAYGKVIDIFESFEGDIEEAISRNECIGGGANTNEQGESGEVPP